MLSRRGAPFFVCSFVRFVVVRRRSSPKPSDVVALRLSFAGPWVALWTPAGVCRSSCGSLTSALHLCAHVEQFHVALKCDAFVSSSGFFSVSQNSSRSLFPRSPLALHHARKLSVLLSRHLIRALRTSGGSDARRAAVHRRHATCAGTSPPRTSTAPCSVDPFVNLLGSFSLHSRRSLAPRRPLSLHHLTNDFPEPFGRPMIASRSRRRRAGESDQSYDARELFPRKRDINLLEETLVSRET